MGKDLEKKQPVGDSYKVTMLQRMLESETNPTEVHYGAKLSHDAANTLTIDAGGIGALIEYYTHHKTDLGNGEED